MQQVDISKCPVKLFYVRKRKHHNKVYLIHLNRIFELTPFSEAVWDLCGGQIPVSGMATVLASRFQMNMEDAMEDVIRNIFFYRNNQLIQYDKYTG